MIRWLKNLFIRKNQLPTKKEIDGIKTWMSCIFYASPTEKYIIKYIEPTNTEREIIETAVLQLPEESYIHKCSQNKN